VPLRILDGIESALAELGVRMGDWPDLETEIAGLVGPEAPDSAEDAMKGVAMKPRFVGAEAWLSELKASVEEAKPAEDRTDVSLEILSRNG
jgi:hypothetical protein